MTASVAIGSSAHVFADPTLDAGALQQQIEKEAPDVFTSPLPSVGAPEAAPSQMSQSMDFAKFIQRDVQQRMMKQLDDGDDRQPSVAVGQVILENVCSDCNSKREQKNSANVAECDASEIR